MEEKLKRIVEDEGGLFEFDNFEHPSIKSYFDSIQFRYSSYQNFVKDIYSNKSASVNVFFINSMEVNACANTYKDENEKSVDYILIFAGLPYALLNIYLRILSQPTTFTDVGDCSKEVSIDAQLIKIDKILENPQDIKVFPKCNIREQYALELARTALNFVFCHELAHIYRGHSDYLNINKNKLLLPHPLDVSRADENTILALQAIEFDADLIGVKITWRLMSIIGKHFSPLKAKLLDITNNSPSLSILLSPSHAFFALTIATYTYFRMYAKNWSSKTQFFDSKGQKEHPDSEVRMIYILKDFIDKQEPITEYEDIVTQWNENPVFFKNYMLSLQEAEKGFALIQGEEINLRPLFSTVLLHEDHFPKYIDMLLNKRAELMPELESYMRGKDFNY